MNIDSTNLYEQTANHIVQTTRSQDSIRQYQDSLQLRQDGVVALQLRQDSIKHYQDSIMAIAHPFARKEDPIQSQSIDSRLTYTEKQDSIVDLRMKKEFDYDLGAITIIVGCGIIFASVGKKAIDYLLPTHH